ncbi:DUF1801 domain-containing protein [Urechidicola croceus]|uniref:YdhG-like domain-containing protein n=1 Tax=Urechidicola croceus TaxID=1850246 RepID=A0A1D8PB18_9FLAO|nr:DUF1801 domain-containing protein [Urechidicola croceus]AOW21753.1 hypothetical protein LPB138_14165 [Urechidicola croceus]
MNPVEQYLYSQNEPYQSIMLYVRIVIFKTLPKVEERFSYKIPFYYQDKKPMIYLNVLKGTNFVDVAFVQGCFLEKQFPILKDYNNRKQVRSIQIEKIEDLDELEFVNLLKSASQLLDKSKKAWNP